MRDLYDTIATGPVQGDSHRAILKSVAADLAGMPATAPAEALDGDVSGKPSQVHSGSNASQRASNAAQGKDLGLVMAMLDFSDRGYASPRGVGAIYTAALRAMGPDPIPLVSDEPWVESDEAYRKRLAPWAPMIVDGDDVQLAAARLDGRGCRIGLPRARLVPVEG